jgi:putative copper export protein
VNGEPLIHWSEPIMQLIGFVGLFLSAGAIGFRYAVVRGHASAEAAAAGIPPNRAVYCDAARLAAIMGLVGAIITTILFIHALPSQAARAHTTVGALVATNKQVLLQAVMLALALLGFVLAAGWIMAGWPLALIGVVVGTLYAALWGGWTRVVNPAHELAAGLWIGTLFVLVVAGLSAVLRDESRKDRRGVIVQDMVNGFSPLALVMGICVVLFGLITAWRHLHVLSNLWTTPYGYALIVKLCIVAFVFGLGAWNWKRQRPTLGSEGAAVSIRRSATGELIAAGLVLLATAILVSLPSPRPPKAAPPPIPAALR